MPVIIGSVTLSTAAIATAASTALPPRLRISSPVKEASGWLEATMPFCARTTERPAFCAAEFVVLMWLLKSTPQIQTQTTRMVKGNRLSS
jgi:hypothetical protein